MPTQRPFFANILAVFRAHSAIQQGKAASPSSSTPQAHAVSHAPSQPRSISTNTTKTSATATALNSLHSPRAQSSTPPSRSPQAQPDGARDMASQAHGRRGSDSSSEGFRDVLGAEKWYVGGRTAAGEERYFKLGVIKRQRSLSLDRLSL